MKARDTSAGIFIKVEEFDHCSDCRKGALGICALQELLKVHKGVDIDLVVIRCRGNDNPPGGYEVIKKEAKG